MKRRTIQGNGSTFLAGVVLLALLSSLFIPLGARAAVPETLDPAALEAFFDELLPAQLEEGRIPGAAVAVVRGDELLLARGYGHADLEARRPIDPQRTLFRTGSVAKLVTWTAVMQQVEQGRIDLHADVNHYLDFVIPATFPAPVTLAHLLTHTAGFEDVGEGLFVLDPATTMPLGDYLRARLPDRVFPPGAVQAYSNYGTALAAYLVERAAGEPFNAYVARRIFAPLGMARSSLQQPPPAELAADLAAGYAFHDGGYLRGDFIFVGPAPAGALSASATDMARFLRAHLSGGALLQPETLAEMQRRQFAPDSRLDGMTYGWMERTSNGRRVLYHRGSILQFNAGLYMLPAEQVGLYVAYNGSNGAAVTDALWRAFADRFFPAESPGPLVPPAGANERIAPYAGEYHLARAEQRGGGKVLRLLEAAHVRASPEGELLLMVEGKTEPYVEVEPALYRHRERVEYLAFFPAGNGVQGLALDGTPAFDTLTATTALRAPWYATTPVTALILLVGLLLFTLLSVGWLAGGLRRRRRQAVPALAARLLAAGFGLLLLAFVVVFVAVLADSDPAYGVPRIFFGPTPLLQLLLLLPWTLVVAGVAMLVTTGLAWLGVGNAGRPYWGRAGRLQYAGLTLLAGGALWVLWYWNLLALPG
jgi:CubicO group peptidase (beta-lactamase class C family)